jgi:hypothetical protein
MPLRKTKAGWYWGSKGAFPTKAQALAVARAAYVHGYQGDEHKIIFCISSQEEEKKVPLRQRKF